MISARVWASTFTRISTSLTDDGRAVGDVLDLGDIDQLVKLLDRLIDHAVIAIDHESETADAGRFAVPDRQALDVEIAAAEQARPLDSARPAYLPARRRQYVYE